MAWGDNLFQTTQTAQPTDWSSQNQQFINLARSVNQGFGGQQEQVPGFSKAAEPTFGASTPMDYNQIHKFLQDNQTPWWKNLPQIQGQQPQGPQTAPGGLLGSVGGMTGLGDLNSALANTVGAAAGGMNQIAASSSGHQILNLGNIKGNQSRGGLLGQFSGGGSK